MNIGLVRIDLRDVVKTAEKNAFRGEPIRVETRFFLGSEFACGGLKIPKRPTLGKHALFPDIRPQETSRRPSGAPGKPRRPGG